MPLFSSSSPLKDPDQDVIISHGFEPRVVEGFFGPATLSGRAFFFHGRDVAALGSSGSDVDPSTIEVPTSAGGRLDLSAVAKGPTHLKVIASATDVSWADIKQSKGWPEKPTDVILTAEAGNPDGKKSSSIRER